MRKIALIMLMVLCMAFTAEAHEYTEIFNSMTEADYVALRKVVYWESAIADCPIETDIAVVRTVMNRVLDSEWPDTVSGVILQKGQFWTNNFGKTVIYPEKVDDAISYVYLHGAEDFPINSTYFATKKQSLGKNHVWIGAVKFDGSPRKGLGMYFCQPK